MRTLSNKKEQLTTIKPVDPIAPYLGGKRKLAKVIVPLIEKIPHNLYAEPFVGMGGVFFRRNIQPNCEVINDINYDIANLFRIIERFPTYLIDLLKFKICSRLEFQRLLATPPELLTDLERAARFLYLQKNAFGGKVSGQSFGVATERPARFNSSSVNKSIKELHERLQKVFIECLPYQDLISRYDREKTLFYLDPPYWNCESDYGKNIFSKDDFKALAGLLKGIKGNFIMSLNDVPEIRKVFKNFYIIEVQTKYSVKVGKQKEVTELLISNVDLNNL